LGQAEEERLGLAEEERLGLAEEERLGQAEEERLGQVEEEKFRKAQKLAAVSRTNSRLALIALSCTQWICMESRHI
jgi:hypothetical protein